MQLAYNLHIVILIDNSRLRKLETEIFYVDLIFFHKTHDNFIYIQIEKILCGNIYGNMQIRAPQLRPAS